MVLGLLAGIVLIAALVACLFDGVSHSGHSMPGLRPAFAKGDGRGVARFSTVVLRAAAPCSGQGPP